MGKDLPSLPPSKNKFWDGAEKEQHPSKKRVACKHFFIRLTSVEVECKTCHVGFYLNPTWELKEGHIYKTSSGDEEDQYVI